LTSSNEPLEELELEVVEERLAELALQDVPGGVALPEAGERHGVVEVLVLVVDLLLDPFRGDFDADLELAGTDFLDLGLGAELLLVVGMGVRSLSHRPRILGTGFRDVKRK